MLTIFPLTEEEVGTVSASGFVQCQLIHFDLHRNLDLCRQPQKGI